MLSDSDPYGMQYDGGQLALAGAELTQLEKRADESDRYVNSWLKCRYLRDRIGQRCEVLITTFVRCGGLARRRYVGAYWNLCGKACGTASCPAARIASASRRVKTSLPLPAVT
jgi:hypothetical protein